MSLIEAVLKKLLYPFHLTYNLSPFLFDCFSNSKFFLICFLQFFFVKFSSNLFSFKIINNICPRNSTFNFFNQKNFWATWFVTFYESIFVFWYSNNITNFKFRNFFIIFLTRVKIFASFYINRLYFDGSMMYCCIYSVYYLTYQYIFVWYLSNYL